MFLALNLAVGGWGAGEGIKPIAKKIENDVKIMQVIVDNDAENENLDSVREKIANKKILKNVSILENIAKSNRD